MAMRGRFVRASAFALAVVASALADASPVAACSPPFEPSIAALGPDQVVLLGRIGERVEGGRLFHVERQWNADSRTSPIVIAFKEGEPVGDCSYPVSTGQHLVIAPERDPDGRLTANLATLQADPGNADGEAYLAEARSLYGEGTVPVEAAGPSRPGARPVWLIALALAAVGVVTLVVIRRRRRRT